MKFVSVTIQIMETIFIIRRLQNEWGPGTEILLTVVNSSSKEDLFLITDGIR